MYLYRLSERALRTNDEGEHEHADADRDPHRLHRAGWRGPSRRVQVETGEHHEADAEQQARERQRASRRHGARTGAPRGARAEEPEHREQAPEVGRDRRRLEEPEEHVPRGGDDDREQPEAELAVPAVRARASQRRTGAVGAGATSWRDRGRGGRRARWWSSSWSGRAGPCDERLRRRRGANSLCSVTLCGSRLVQVGPAQRRALDHGRVPAGRPPGRPWYTTTCPFSNATKYEFTAYQPIAAMPTPTMTRIGRTNTARDRSPASPVGRAVARGSGRCHTVVRRLGTARARRGVHARGGDDADRRRLHDLHRRRRGAGRTRPDRRGHRARERVLGLGLRVEHDDGDVVLAAGGVRGVDERVRRAGRVRVLAQDLADRGGPDHRGEPVGAQDHAVAALQDQGVHVDLDRRVDAERARDDRPLRVDRGLLLGELAVADQLLDEAVVGGQPLEPVPAEQVGAGVADVARWSACRRRRSPR